jgi:segregation and condensation protein B
VAKTRRAAKQESVAEDAHANGESDEAEEALESVEELSREDTKRAVYALLFASDRPLSVARLAEALGDDLDKDVVETLLGELCDEIEQSDVPFRLRDIAGGFQLTTEGRYAPYIRRLFQLKKKNKLSKAVLETLAIIAYRQPVTRPDVESIRGVSVSHAFNLLQERRLIKAVGVADVPGRPRLYRTTDEFLLHFGLRSIEEMPTIEELREMV